MLRLFLILVLSTANLANAETSPHDLGTHFDDKPSPHNGTTDEADAKAPQPSCIEKPEDYLAAWKAFQVDCVSPQLLGTLYSPGQTSLYPEGFLFSWAGAHNNLEMFLRLNLLYGDPSKDAYNPNKVLNGATTIMGFPTAQTSPLMLAVYTLADRQGVQVPSFETWMMILERELGWTYSLAAQKQLLIAYAKLFDRDVIDVYAELSGCPYDSLAQGNITDCGNPAYRQAIEAAGCSPYEEGCTTVACFQSFFSEDLEPSATAIRAALAMCQDASALNTGMGIGYNTLPNPFICKPKAAQSIHERYTGREFILRNRSFDSLKQAVQIELPYDEEASMAFLEMGYCQ